MLLLDAVKPNLSPAKHHMVYQQVVEAPSKLITRGLFLPDDSAWIFVKSLKIRRQAYPMFG